MESSVQRRLDYISRHLLLLPEVDTLALYPVLVKGEEIKHNEEADPVVIGGMVLDIHATPSIPPYPRTTTPGKVQYALGGVARNIAECMSKLGTKPYMISALGNDMAGNLLLEHWNSAGLSTEGIQKHQKIRTAVISNIFDAHGEVAAGVADVEAVEKFLTPEWILQCKCKISSASVLLVDANLTPPALEASCQVAAEYNIPVWFEPVSVAKSTRIASIVSDVTFASPNEDELIAMANALSCASIFHPIDRDSSKKYSTESLFQMLKPAILVLLEKGIKTVAVTLGANGVFLCSTEPNFTRTRLERTKKYGYNGSLYDIIESSCPSSKFSDALQTQGSSHLLAVHFPTLPASVVRLTGAGDCLVGGTLASLCSGLDIMQSMAVGIVVAKTAVETEGNVPSAFSLASISDDARLVYSAARVLFHQSML
ncbi:ribokinase isoform X1 [Ricinus communis]|uniref:ribokinase isoform X1 n=1 Tax=Ricinus communis TaxID=3988 RepID=UPI000772491E|nr:ribokinase isoform X1 [Ricinus communis]|eukprot:XP_015574632.1 ribokinase isoform X1 [Ricinus communis]